MRKRSSIGEERGAASVEHVGLVALVALVLLAGVAAVAAGGDTDSGRTLARAIGRKIACAPRLPDSCRHHATVPAYGWPLARLLRALAPLPTAVPGPSGLPLVPVDFRRCRRESCAVPSSRPGLTTSNRRVTAFTSIIDRRATLGWVEVTYWLYRPALGWERVVRRATRPEVEASSGVRVLDSEVPALVPLETLPGRDQYDFIAREEPPWRWSLESIHPGWSS